MSQRSPSPNANELRTFATKLREFRGTLAPQEQQILDALLKAAAGDYGDVHGYGLTGATIQRLLAYLGEGPTSADDEPGSPMSTLGHDVERTTRARERDPDL